MDVYHTDFSSNQSKNLDFERLDSWQFTADIDNLAEKLEWLIVVQQLVFCLLFPNLVVAACCIEDGQYHCVLKWFQYGAIVDIY